jgi:Mrp family chromosome partitioning ATPase
MTTTNQAFIKAFRLESAHAGPSAPEIAEDHRLSAAALKASVEIVAASANYAARSPSHRSAAHQEFATTIDVLPPATQPSIAAPFLFKAGLGESGHTTRQLQPRRIDTAAGAKTPLSTKKPLSAFIARPQAPRRPIARPAKSDSSRVGTTVASFRWPPAGRAIMRECAADLQHVANQLVEQVALGRSMFGIMSLFPQSGATTAAFCLAAHLAGSGRRVVLIEGSFYTPRLATWLDVVPTAGWQEVLENASLLPDALVRSVDERLDVLLLGNSPPFDPLPLVTSHQAIDTARALRKRYELALVDLGAFFDPRSQPVALELTRTMEIEAVLAVAGPDPIDPRDITTMDEHLQRNGCDLLGLIENRISDSSPSS